MSFEKQPFYIWSEDHGWWGWSGMLERVFRRVLPPEHLKYELVTDFENKHINDPNAKGVVIQSVFPNPAEQKATSIQRPYVTWCGEAMIPKKNKAHWPLVCFDAVYHRLINCVGPQTKTLYVWYPFILCNPHAQVPVRTFVEWQNTGEFFCAYIASNPVPKREQMFRELLKLDQTHSCHAIGTSMHNCSLYELEPRMNGTSYLRNGHIYRRYRFALVMENQDADGYITEKVRNAFRAGCIPIYWGSRGYIKEVFNPKAMINVGDFESLEACAQFVTELDRDPKRLAEMRAQPIFVNNELPELFYGELDYDDPQWLKAQWLTMCVQHLQERLGL